MTGKQRALYEMQMSAAARRISHAATILAEANLYIGSDRLRELAADLREEVWRSACGRPPSPPNSLYRDASASSQT